MLIRTEQKFTLGEVYSILKQAERVEQASISRDLTDPRLDYSRIDLNTGAARLRTDAFKVAVPHKAIYFAGSTRRDTVLYYKPALATDASADLALRPGDVLIFDNPKATAEFYWSIFNDNTANLFFFHTDGRVEPGFISINERNYPIEELADTSNTAVSVGTTATAVFDGVNEPVLTGTGSLPLSRLKEVHLSPDAAVFYGDSGVTTATGIPLAAGEILIYDQEAPLYMVCAAGTVNVRKHVVYRRPQGTASGGIPARS